ncbi:hypothetical protein QQ020_22545 [Fulvivirgaceae bacterium BMA12]|uniref:Lipoprotein n=1 Tax=Agaribacillus aureus TaxID=3051825 RepID=A0ABT8LD31_9BACT|nr:hypothetical protein [Fulvivirgaceae bacterium BMA12]
MKTVKHWIVIIGVICLFSSCQERNILTETVVHPDGSLDRVITLEDFSKSAINRNRFGISPKSGWEIELDSIKSKNDSSKLGKKKKLVIRFRKHFSSAQESNEELNTSVDTLFTIKSTFEKRFRWFYTYLYYSDTYGAIDRFKYVSQEDYFTQEDYAFIDRLPAEGKEISKADKLFDEYLHDKIGDEYAVHGIFEEQYHILTSLMESYKLESRWFDTLSKHKESLLDLAKMDDVDDDIVLIVADRLGIPLPYPQAKKDYELLNKDYERRINFMTGFISFTHSTNMPWQVIRTNADSVSGSNLFWRPPVIKYMLKDYEMYAESRKINYWAVAVSILVVMLTIFLIVKKGRRV